MDNITAKQQKILINLLEKDYTNHGNGINTQFVRNNYCVVDVPTRKSEVIEYFKRKGFIIDSRREKNRTATYFLRPIIKQEVHEIAPDVKNPTLFDPLPTPDYENYYKNKLTLKENWLKICKEKGISQKHHSFN